MMYMKLHVKDLCEHIIPTFELKLVNKSDLRKYIKKLKGGRSSGFDDVDSFSLKLASHLIEDVLLHLVNLAITNS